MKVARQRALTQPQETFIYSPSIEMKVARQRALTPPAVEFGDADIVYRRNEGCPTEGIDTNPCTFPLTENPA